MLLHCITRAEDLFGGPFLRATSIIASPSNCMARPIEPVRGEGHFIKGITCEVSGHDKYVHPQGLAMWASVWLAVSSQCVRLGYVRPASPLTSPLASPPHLVLSTTTSIRGTHARCCDWGWGGEGYLPLLYHGPLRLLQAQPRECHIMRLGKGTPITYLSPNLIGCLSSCSLSRQITSSKGNCGCRMKLCIGWLQPTILYLGEIK